MSNAQHDRTPQRRLGTTPTPAPMAAGISIELPSRLNVESVTRLYQTLSPLANHNAPVTVAGARVSHVNVAALRVLAAFFRVRKAHGEATLLRNPSETLRAGARHAGLAVELGLAGGA